jgi:hypothetical protein
VCDGLGFIVNSWFIYSPSSILLNPALISAHGGWREPPSCTKAEYSLHHSPGITRDDRTLVGKLPHARITRKYAEMARAAG